MKLRHTSRLLIGALLLVALLGACGIPTDTQPRDIDPEQQINLNKP